MVAAAIDRWWDPEKQQGLQDMCAAAPSCTSNLCNAAFLLIFVKGFRYYNRAYTTEAGVAGLVLCQSTKHSAGGILHNSRHRKGLLCTATQVRLL